MWFVEVVLHQHFTSKVFFLFAQNLGSNRLISGRGARPLIAALYTVID
jgi:hypothetical protein